MVRAMGPPLLAQTLPLRWSRRGAPPDRASPSIPALPRAYSLVNVHRHCKVVHGEDRGVVVEAAVSTDVELRAPGSRKEM